MLGGVPAHWRLLKGDSSSDPEWAKAYRSLDIISPWTMGRFKDDAGADRFLKQFLIPDLVETKKLGIDYMAVAWPGFSWHNGAGRARNDPLNETPRQCGSFYKHQIDNIINAGVDMLYTAMFDEANEATAMFKLAVHSEELPEGVGFVPLDDGDCQIAKSDMYLRHAGDATRQLRSGKPLPAIAP